MARFHVSRQDKKFVPEMFPRSTKCIRAIEEDKQVSYLSPSSKHLKLIASKIDYIDTTRSRLIFLRRLDGNRVGFLISRWMEEDF